jgi:hypothetical protein
MAIYGQYPDSWYLIFGAPPELPGCSGNLTAAVDSRGYWKGSIHWEFIMLAMVCCKSGLQQQLTYKDGMLDGLLQAFPS